MQFKIWLEDIEEKGFDYYRNLLLGKLNLDKIHGLSQEIDTWEPETLINILNGLGEFHELPENVQSQVIGQIRSGSGVLEDLVKIMANKY